MCKDRCWIGFGNRSRRFFLFLIKLNSWGACASEGSTHGCLVARSPRLVKASWIIGISGMSLPSEAPVAQLGHWVERKSIFLILHAQEDWSQLALPRPRKEARSRTVSRLYVSVHNLVAIPASVRWPIPHRYSCFHEVVKDVPKKWFGHV